MLDREINISPVLFKVLSSLLSTGKIEHEENLLDLSPVQTITISKGKVTLDPPAKVSAKIAGIRILTTISEITKSGSGINININNSPIDLELKPK